MTLTDCAGDVYAAQSNLIRVSFLEIVQKFGVIVVQYVANLASALENKRYLPFFVAILGAIKAILTREPNRLLPDKPINFTNLSIYPCECCLLTNLLHL